MKIAYFTETFLPNVDGIVVKIQHLLDYMDEREHASILFSPRYRDMPTQYKSTKVYGKAGWKFPPYPQLKMVYPWTRVEAELKSFKPDLIHLINPAAMGLVGLRAAKSLDIPVVASYHTDVPGFARRWRMGYLYNPLYGYFRTIHNQCDLNFAPSHETVRQLEENGFERLQVWRGGVDVERFASHNRNNEMRMRLTDGEPEKPLLLFVSRLSQEKRPEMLLDVIKSLPNTRLAIVGDGPNRKKMERLFAGTPTVFTGFLQGEELAQAYASGDIFLFAGANETFGNVIIEAMASGLPIVAPNSGGLIDFVSHDETGFLYEVDDTVSMIEAVRTLLEDPALAWRFGLRGRAVAEEHSWPHVLDDLIVEYQHVLDGDYGVNSGVDTIKLEDDVTGEEGNVEPPSKTDTVEEIAAALAPNPDVSAELEPVAIPAEPADPPLEDASEEA